MLALSAVVGAGVFAPVPDESFYLVCAMGELLIGLIAYHLDTQASRPIMRISAILMMLHCLGWLLDGYPPDSPYHYLVGISEHAELFKKTLDFLKGGFIR